MVSEQRFWHSLARTLCSLVRYLWIPLYQLLKTLGTILLIIRDRENVEVYCERPVDYEMGSKYSHQDNVFWWYSNKWGQKRNVLGNEVKKKKNLNYASIINEDRAKREILSFLTMNLTRKKL